MATFLAHAATLLSGMLRSALVLALLGTAFVMVPMAPALAEDAAEAGEVELWDLEDLIYMEVTSVAKRSGKLAESPAAIYVITQDDIRRMGAVTIPEALRVVPGLQVASITANSYAISSRGLNGMFADKLLVLIDGRSVYTPTMGGVFWGVQDTMMEDIDRIEVIRGPGATLWGANAVNGVINVITKTAEETQGGLLVAGAGNQETAFGSLRYGGQTEIGGNVAHYRMYGKINSRNENINRDRTDGPDDSNTGRVGFRMDWDGSEKDSFTVQGDAYSGDEGFGYTAIESLSSEPDYDLYKEDDWSVSGGNILGRWTRDISETNSLTLQSYFDRTDRDSDLLGIERNTFDLDFQHRFEWMPNNTLTWGLGYRFTGDEMDNTVALGFYSDDQTDNLYSGFLQNEMSFFDDKLRLTLGSKAEHNDYTGWEFQPSVRSAYIISDKQSVWASASRAVQTRSRVDYIKVTQLGATAADSPFGLQINGQIVGDSDGDAQRVYAYELGYRVRPWENVSLDLTGYINEYTGLSDIEPVDEGNPIFVPEGAPPEGIILQGPFGSNIYGQMRGVELTANWQVVDALRLGAGYAYTHGNFNGSKGGGEGVEEHGQPTHQYHVRSYLELAPDLQLDSVVYYVGEAGNKEVSSYYRLDLRLGWQVCENTELSLVGQNLNQHAHREWNDELGTFRYTEVPRAVYAKINWEF